MTELSALGKKHGTDKFPHYTEFYDALLSRRRGEILKVVEAGIGTEDTMTHVPGYRPGASLRMWEEYFPNAWIYGLDINPTVLFSQGRILTQPCDQNDASSLTAAAEWIGSGVDFVVDDGDHHAAAQLKTFAHVFPLLRRGGLYIIEDAAEGAALSTGLRRATFNQHSMISIRGELDARLILVIA